MEQRIGIERMEEAIDIFGSFDENIRLLESELHVTVVSRGGELCISGDVENVMVKEYAPFILSYIATMFFGVQFETLDKRRFKTIEITV